GRCCWAWGQWAFQTPDSGWDGYSSSTRFSFLPLFQRAQRGSAIPLCLRPIPLFSGSCLLEAGEASRPLTTPGIMTFDAGLDQFEQNRENPVEDRGGDQHFEYPKV